MAIITYPLALPVIQRPEIVLIKPQVAVGYAESQFTFQGYAQIHQGQRWTLMVQFPPMRATEEAASAMEAFLTALNGRAGTFTAGPMRSARGIATGTPLINGASQTGSEILTDGWTAGQTGILKANDFLQIGSNLHKVLADADSDSDGEATLAIFPNLRSSPADNAPIITTNPVGIWRLTENIPEVDRDALFLNIVIDAYEVL
jgi:hypothetical protein